MTLVAAIGLAALSPGLAPPAFTVNADQGLYDGWEGSSAGIVALKAGVSVYRLGPYGRWLPGITAQLSNGTSHVMLKVNSYAAGMPLSVEVFRYAGDKEVEWLRLPIGADPTLPFDVELRWTAEGVICLSLTQAGRSYRHLMNLGVPPATVGLFGSGGEFRFDPVVLIAEATGRERAAAELAVKADCVPVS